MKVFTTGQVAKICKVAPRTVSKWFDSGRLRGYRIPGSQDRRIPREYVARNTIEVRIDDLPRAGDVLDVAVQAGAASIGGIRFDLRDRAAAEREALRLAVADARARADAAASGAGRAIDRIVKIEDAREIAIIQPRPMMTMARAEAPAAPTPIESGVIEIRARVTLTASMK